ncbi:tigger transposable element-derived protein 1 [Trichonephila clavipes]|nr:tigger transposable element-derived protein 1 [Trichonephila clavipes]
MSKVSTIASDACVTPSDHGCSESYYDDTRILERYPKHFVPCWESKSLVVKSSASPLKLDLRRNIYARWYTLLSNSKAVSYAAFQHTLSESNVRAIKKNEAAIRKSVISGTKLSTKFASYTRDVLLERTERAIAIWIEEQVQRRIPVSGYLIQEKALQFYKSMKLSEPSTYTSQAGKEFSASKGWLIGFFKRNALHNIKITGESATADKGAAKIFPEELAKIIEDGDYSVEIKYLSLMKQDFIGKNCLTVLTSQRMKKLQVDIKQTTRPKGKDLKQLPVHWMANPKAWMTTAIFTEWFNNCFVPEVEAYMKEKSLDFKVLLIVDNAASHPQLEHPNVKLVFLLLNTTSLIQPLDQGVIATFKKYYIKTTSNCRRRRSLEGDDDEEEKSTPLTGKLIQEGLQLCSKLENHFLINDPNSERASKLQRELQNCMSGYRELYKKIKESSSQSLITDYIVRKGRATQNENEVCENPWPLPQISIAETVSSDDDSDLEPLRKRCKPLSDSDND